MRRLNQDVIAHAVLPVQPEVGGHLAAAAQRNQQTAGDVPLGEAELAGLDAIHVDAQLGGVHHLMDVNVDRARNALDPLRQTPRNRVIWSRIAASDLDVDGSRQPGVENLVGDIGRFEEEHDVGKFLP